MGSSTLTPAPDSPARKVYKVGAADFHAAPRGVYKIAAGDFTPAKAEPSVPTPTPAGPTESPIKQIGKGIVRQGAGMAPLIAGTEMGAALGMAAGGPAGAFIGGVGGAIVGGLAIPASVYLMERAMGEETAPPTFGQAAVSAVVAGGTQMAAPLMERLAEPIVESALGIRGAGEIVRKARAEGEAAGTALQERQENIRQHVAGRQTASDAEVARKSTELQAKQAQARQDIAAERLKALTEHAKAITDAEAQVSTARAKLRQNIATDVEAGRAEAAEKVANEQAQQMMGKTIRQLQQQQAGSSEQASAARASASSPYWKASSKWHEEVGDAFEPFIGKIEKNVIPPDSVESLKGKIAEIQATTAARGQTIVSSDLKKMFGELGGEEHVPTTAEILKGVGTRRGPEGSALVLNRTQRMALETAQSGEAPKPLTYGQLWGNRARANKVLASASNPADRAAANEFVRKVNEMIPGVPQNIRDNYAAERIANRDMAPKIARAGTRQEVGEGIFGTKAAPERPEKVLPIIRFTKKYNPEGMDGLRGAFADRYLGSRMDANDLGRMNAQVLKELYDDNADNVLRLLGPEGDVKQRSWAALIHADPQARDMLEQGVRESMQRQINITQREAIAEGERALSELPSKYDYVRRAMNAAKTPEAKLKILAEQMPTPKQIQPTGPESKILAQQPPDVGKGVRRALQKGAPGLGSGFERYTARYLGRVALFSLASGGAMYGYLWKKPQVMTAMIVAAAALGGRGMARSALTTEGGATLYMKALDMDPTSANALAFGRVMGNMGATAITQQMWLDGAGENE